MIFSMFVLAVSSVYGQSFTQCIDSDFGLNPYKQGTLTFTDANGKVSTFTDGDGVVSSARYLTEYYCLNGYNYSETIDCQFGRNFNLGECNNLCQEYGDQGYDPYTFGVNVIPFSTYQINTSGFQFVDKTNDLPSYLHNSTTLVINSSIEDLPSSYLPLLFLAVQNIIGKKLYYDHPIIDQNKLVNFFKDASMYGKEIKLENVKYDYRDSSTNISYETYCDSNLRLKESQVPSCIPRNHSLSLKLSTGTVQINGTIGECTSILYDTSQTQCQSSISTTGWGNFDNDNSTINDNCCGVLKQDFGKIVVNPSGEQHICLPGSNGKGDWVYLSETTSSISQLPGTIFKVNREETTPKDLFNHSINKDKYDIVVNNNGEFIACDIDNSLGSSFSKKTFNDFGYCFGSSGNRCLTLSSSTPANQFTSQFLCYSEGDRESLAECAVTPSQRFNKISEGDNYEGYVPGEYLFSPFSKNYSEFGSQNKCQGAKELCLWLDNAGDTVDANVNKQFVWDNYDFLEFDIFSQKGFVGNVTYEVRGESGVLVSLLSESIIASKQETTEKWYKVRIPLSGTGILRKAVSVKLTAEESLEQVKIENIHFVSSSQLVCAQIGSSSEAKWVHELDDVQYKSACNSRFSGWTGTMCCGDDFSNGNILSSQGQTEYFTDNDAMCFNSVSYPKNGLSPIIVKNMVNQTISSQRLLTNGTNLFGCNLGNEYNWAKNILQTDNNGNSIPNSNLNVIEYSSCEFVEQNGKSYFCSPDGWSDASYSTSSGTVLPKDRTVLSTNIGGNSSQCCSPNTCWDGNSCVLPSLPQPGQTSATLCVNGQWRTNAGKQSDWLNLEFDFCPSDTSCLLDTSLPRLGSDNLSSQKGTLCKPNTWFSKLTTISGVGKDVNLRPIDPKYSKVSSLYCNSGNWTSRTSFIAERLLTLRNDDYTLVCGPREEVLVNNNIGRAYNSIFTGSNDFVNSYDTRYFNDLCILSYEENGKNIVVVGSSFNELGDGSLTNPVSLNNVLRQSFDIDRVDVSNCEGSSNVHEFLNCPNTFSTNSKYVSGNRFYWNNLTQSFIYTPNGGVLIPTSPISKLYNILITPILNLLGSSRPSQITSPQPLVNSKMYNFVYFSKSNGKEIKMLIEPRNDQGNVKEFVSVTYDGFTEDICGSVDVIDPSGQKVICSQNGTTTNLFAFTGPDTPLSMYSSLSFVKSASVSTRVK